MNLKQSALRLAEKGFHVFPLKVNSKLPLIDDFPNRASKDPKQIIDWWEDPVMGIDHSYNVGISTTEYNCTQSLVVVDVDNKKGKCGGDELLKLEMSGFDFDHTYTQKTPTGGEHMVYKTPKPVKQGVNVLAKGLDIRGRGGYIVGAGSVLNGEVYEGDDQEIADCPEWIVKKCGEPKEKSTREVDVSNLNETQALSRGRDYLKSADIAIEGEGGTATTYLVAAKLKDFGLSPTNSQELMLEWNEKCDPPWEVEEIEKIIQSVYLYGKEPVGVLAPEADFEVIESDDENKSYLEKINDRHALILGDGGHSILEETVDEKGRQKRIFYNEASFKRKFSTDLVYQEKGKPKTYAEVWLDWKGRREYKGLCFRPEKTARNNYYNLWKGFNAKPKPYAQSIEKARAAFDMYMSHIQDNVCEGDKELFNWLIGYFAHLVQRPSERPLVTLVFKGSKGVGKNVVVDRIGKLIGTGHYLVAHNSRFLTSNFNGHMDSCLCLVLDEAFWSGDKSADGILKGLTTSPEILIERKGKEPYQVDNLIRLIIIGNEEWLVPASADERRYAVFQIGEARKQDIKYFDAMVKGMDNLGGNEILLDHLQKFDLKTVEVNKAPYTQALQDQKEMSLSPMDQFWKECLDEGSIIGVDFLEGWPDKVTGIDFRKAVNQYFRSRNVKTWLPDSRAIGKKVKSWMPDYVPTRKKMTDEKGNRVRCYFMPPLEDCREHWDKVVMGGR